MQLLVDIWKHSEHTRRFLSDIKSKIQETKDDLSTNIQLMQKPSEQIAHEYIANVAYIRGLSELVKWIEESDDEQHIDRHNQD